MNNVFNNIDYEITRRIPELKKIGSCTIDTLKGLGTTLVGIIATPFSAVTCGKYPKLNNWAENTVRAAHILPNIFFRIMKIINPSCRMVNPDFYNLGRFSESITKKIQTKVMNLSAKGQTNFNKQVTLRAVHAAAIPVLVITRCADGLLAIPAVAFSVLTGGTEPKVNKFATIQLRSAGFLILDISRHLRFAVNPNAF